MTNLIKNFKNFIKGNYLSKVALRDVKGFKHILGYEHNFRILMLFTIRAFIVPYFHENCIHVCGSFIGKIIIIN